MSDQVTNRVSGNSAGASLVKVQMAKRCIREGVYERPHNMDVIADICVKNLALVIERGHLDNPRKEAA